MLKNFFILIFLLKIKVIITGTWYMEQQ